MSEPFNWGKAFDFSMPTMGKLIFLGIKLILILGAITAIAWSVYVTMIRPHTKPNPTTSQSADNMYNYYNTPKITFGCSFWQVQKKAELK